MTKKLASNRLPLATAPILGQTPSLMARAKRGVAQSHHGRTRARRTAVQAIYQWQMAGQNLTEIEAQFLQAQDMRKVDVDYFRELLHKIPAQLAVLDMDLKPSLDRAIEQIDPVERAILRIGAYEFRHHPEVPWKVVLNEAIELAKMFGGEESHRFINGILDKLAYRIRSAEIKAGRKRQPA